MKKTTYMMIAMAVLVVLFVSACGGAAPQAAFRETRNKPLFVSHLVPVPHRM